MVRCLPSLSCWWQSSLINHSPFLTESMRPKNPDKTRFFWSQSISAVLVSLWKSTGAFSSDTNCPAFLIAFCYQECSSYLYPCHSLPLWMGSTKCSFLVNRIQQKRGRNVISETGLQETWLSLCWVVPLSLSPRNQLPYCKLLHGEASVARN